MFHSLQYSVGSCSARELARVEREPHDVELVSRELAADERVEREGHLLGGRKQPLLIIERLMSSITTVAAWVRQLRAEHLEVVGGEAHGRARPLPLHRVHERLLEVEQERIAELVGLGLVGAVAARAPPLHGVAAEAVALEVRRRCRGAPCRRSCGWRARSAPACRPCARGSPPPPASWRAPGAAPALAPPPRRGAARPRRDRSSPDPRGRGRGGAGAPARPSAGARPSASSPRAASPRRSPRKS